MDKKEYSIEYNGKVFKASKYQSEILYNIEHGIGNMIINASAGSSKTTTIVNCIRFVPDGKKVLFTAFNKDIVEKIKSNINHPNSKVLTFHALGYRFLIDNREGDQTKFSIINEYKYKNYINNIFKSTAYCSDYDSSKSGTFLSNVRKLVDYSRYYVAFTEKQILNVASIYGIDIIGEEAKFTRDVLIWGKDNVTEIDFTDMIWLPNVLNMQSKGNCFDYIFIDEAQDTSIAEQKLIERCFRRGTRFVAVGDTFQQINVWCGSSETAIENLKRHYNTKEYLLPISYRCPKKIVELARKYSENIIYSDDAIEGEINYDVPESMPSNGDMVLCRNTAPLVYLMLKYMKMNKKCHIRGFDGIYNRIMDIINDSGSEYIDKNFNSDNGLYSYLKKRLNNEIISVMNDFGLSINEVLSHPSIMTLVDDIGCIRILSEGLEKVSELVEKFRIIYECGDENDGVELSTVHKSKGLEADNVFIYMPSLMPSVYANKEWEIKSENNLIYVAYTRSRKTLNFIKENFSDKKNVLLMSESLIGIIEESSGIIMHKSDNSKKIESSIEDRYDFIKVESISSNNKKAGKKLRNLLQ